MTPTPLDSKPQGAQLKRYGWTSRGWEASNDGVAVMYAEAAERIENLERDYDTAMKTNNHQAQIIRDLRGEKGKLRQERDTALRALAEARRDAERYRWLRDNRFGQLLMQFGFTYSQIEHWANDQNKKKLDEAIDAATKPAKGAGDE